MMLKRLTAMLAVLLMHFIGLSKAIISSGGKPFPGIENLPRSFWHELSSPFTEVYEEESFATETGATPEPRPFFEDPDSNITVQLGAQVYLHCRVQNLNARTVSWVRRRGEELHLLTFGQQTYSSDSRFSLDSEMPNNWRLKLSSATERDTGVYECQVSAHPPLIRTVHLTVSVPKVEIVDEHGATAGDKFYKAGSTIELKCVVSKVPHPSGYVTWMHGSRILNYDTIRGGISVKTDMGAEGAVSRLYIANANKKDSGNYSCALADFPATTVSVHVLNAIIITAMGQLHSEPVTTKNSARWGDSKYQVGSSCMQGWRESMEDYHVHILSLPDDPDAAFFAVYDGHRGNEIAQYAGEHLHEYITSQPAYKEGNIEEAMKKGFLELDKVMQTDETLKNSQAGTTVIVILIKDNVLYSANAGDSRAVASVNGVSIPLSYDHKPMLKEERERIHLAGGFVAFNRVNGVLALSRALGDYKFKENTYRKPEEQIVSGENPAAMQHGASEGLRSTFLLTALLTLTTVLR